MTNNLADTAQLRFTVCNVLKFDALGILGEKIRIMRKDYAFLSNPMSEVLIVARTE